MKFTPSSTTRRNSLCAPARSFGGPQISWPSTRMAPKPRRLTSMSPTFMGKLLQHRGEAEGDARHARIVQLLRRVARQVVVRIAEKGGVGDHDRRKAVVAERPVVRPCHAGDERRRRHALRGERRVLAKDADAFP